MSLESADMAYLLMLNEYLDVEEFINEADAKEMKRLQDAEIAARKRNGGK